MAAGAAVSAFRVLHRFPMYPPCLRQRRPWEWCYQYSQRL
jgi:hypothetical protein